MNYSLLIKYTKGDISGIDVEYCLLTHKREIQVAEATEWELKVQEASSPKSGHNSFLSAKDQEDHKWPISRQNII